MPLILLHGFPFTSSTNTVGLDGSQNFDSNKKTTQFRSKFVWIMYSTFKTPFQPYAFYIKKNAYKRFL